MSRSRVYIFRNVSNNVSIKQLVIDNNTNPNINLKKSSNFTEFPATIFNYQKYGVVQDRGEVSAPSNPSQYLRKLTLGWDLFEKSA